MSFLILWHLYLNYLFSRILLRIKISSKSKNFMVFLTCAARSDCDIEPPFEFPKPPSPADWSGDPIRGGVDSFLRGTGLIGSLKTRVNFVKFFLKNRVNFVKFWILNPNLGFILPAELSAIALTVSMRSGIV